MFETNLEQFLAQQALLRFPLAMVITDPHLPDNPIVYVNEAFERITGYAAEVAVGRNCRFLQGGHTDPVARDAVRETIANRQTATIDIYNYRADGSGFWNRLIIGPLYDEAGALRYYVGVQNDMSKIRDDNRVSRHADRVLREVQHRVKNHLSMIVAMVRMHARSDDPAASYEALATRIESLQSLYDEMTNANLSSVESDAVRAGEYLVRIASAIGRLDGRENIRLRMACDEIELPADTAGQIGLLASEFLTNAYKHAFRAHGEGEVTLSLERVDETGVRLGVRDNGSGLPANSRWRSLATNGAAVDDERDRLASGDANGSGLGVRIAKALIHALRAKVTIETGDSGTAITVDVPRRGGAA